MNYSSIATFGGLYFGLGNVIPKQQAATLKQKLGKTFIERRIPMKNTIDIGLDVTGVITGVTTSIDADRTALEALEDGDKHAWDDGKHTGINMAIIPGSLKIADPADREPGEPIPFTMSLIQWQ